MGLIELGCEVVETDDRPLSPMLGIQFGLREQASQGGELLLSARQVLAQGSSLEGNGPIRPVRTQRGMTPGQVPGPLLAQLPRKFLVVRPAATVAQIQGTQFGQEAGNTVYQFRAQQVEIGTALSIELLRGLRQLRFPRYEQLVRGGR